MCGNPSDVSLQRRRAAVSVVSSRRGRNERLQGLDELREVSGHHLSDDVLVHAEVVVHDLVPHPDDVLPGDLGVGHGEVV